MRFCKFLHILQILDAHMNNSWLLPYILSCDPQKIGTSYSYSAHI